MKRRSILLLAAMLLAATLPAQNEGRGQWSLMFSKTYVEGEQSDGKNTGIVTGKEGLSIFTIRHARPEFYAQGQVYKAYENIHKLSVSWSKPPLHLNVGDENKIAIDVQARLDGQGYSREKLASDGFGGTNEGYVVSVDVSVIPEVKVGKKVVGASIMKQAFTQMKNGDDLENYIQQNVFPNSEDDFDKWAENLEQLDWHEQVTDVSSGRLACDDEWNLPPKLGQEACLMIGVTVSFKSNNMVQKNSYTVTHVYLYKISLDEGFWKKVNYSYGHIDYSSYKYTDADNRQTETKVKSLGTSVTYRMECLQDNAHRSTYHATGSCQGEFLEANLTYTKPLDYYAPGDQVQTTYSTKTTHSEYVCPSGMTLPYIQGYLRTPVRDQILAWVENTGGKHQFKALLKDIKTEEATVLGMETKHVMHFTDITENAYATMPGNEAGDTILLCYEVTNGQSRHNLKATYTYVWQEGEMPANASTGQSIGSTPQDGNDDSPIWVLIPIVIGGAVGGAGVAGLIRIRINRRGPKVKPPTPADQLQGREYYETLYNTTDDAAIQNIQSTTQMYAEIDQYTNEILSDKANTNLQSAVVLDKTGDLAASYAAKMVDAEAPGMGTVVKLALVVPKTFLKGMAEDMAEGRDVVKSIVKNMGKTTIDSSKELIPDDVGYAGKVFISTGIDTGTTILEKSLMRDPGTPDITDDELKGEMTKSLVTNLLTNVDYTNSSFARTDDDKVIFDYVGEYVNQSIGALSDDNVQEAFHQ